MKQSFGGNWTEKKLATIREYLKVYMQIMAKQSFKVAYIDAFAGTGSREQRAACQDESSLFNDDDSEAREILAGSARIALESSLNFDRYIYIEKAKSKCSQLKNLKDDFPALADRIKIEQGDANDILLKLCSRNWISHRAVLFLDPFGMQVRWDTIQAIASTKAIDLWYLFPLGMGLNRLLVKNLADMPDEFAKRLDIALGDVSWRQRFYSRRTEQTLFDSLEVIEKNTDFQGMKTYIVERLKTVFAGVAENPAFLYNSKHSPMFLLCFAASNEKGAGPAIRIANSLLRSLDEQNNH